MADPDKADLPAPAANPFLTGHEDAERTLTAAHGSGRLAHAWLITGPRGIGKATLAYRFARFMLAGGAEGGDLFGAADAPRGLHVDPQDPLFRRVAAGSHADLFVLERGTDPKSGRRRAQIVVDDARRLGAFLTLTPAEGGWRVAIIDAADEMNRNAANAVLKLVEEPPDRALVLLVSHVPGRLPATIRSRCRRLVLKPLAAAQVGEVVNRLRPDLDADTAAALARLADGSPGRALALAEEGGLDLYRDLTGLLAGWPGLDIEAVHAFADRLARRGAEPAFGIAIALLVRWLSRLIAAGARRQPPEEIVPGEGETASRLLAAAGLEQWLELWENISRLAARAEQVNLDRKQVVLSAFTAIAGVARG